MISAIKIIEEEDKVEPVRNENGEEFATPNFLTPNLTPCQTKYNQSIQATEGNEIDANQVRDLEPPEVTPQIDDNQQTELRLPSAPSSTNRFKIVSKAQTQIDLYKDIPEKAVADMLP